MFVKVRFTGRHGATAGLVLDAHKVRKMTVGQLSHCFPVSEYGKMTRLWVSPEYPTWDAAFAHSFDAEQEPTWRTCNVEVGK